MTFYTLQEYRTTGLLPTARHIHVLSEDPYTGHLWMGTGDENEESSVWVSKDKGETFELVGSGSQRWRTLSFIFTEQFVFFNTDSPEPQYLTRLDKKQLDSIPLQTECLKSYPLINSALWCTIKDGNMTIMSSNSEGQLYDDNHRTYGIVIDKKGIPTVYNLFQEKSQYNKYTKTNVYHQLFPQGKHVNGEYWFYDTYYNCLRTFRLTKSEKAK